MTSDRSMPWAVCTSHGPIVGPKCGASSRGEAAARSATVMIERSASRLAVREPTPQSASVGLSPRISSQVSLVIVNTPAGLPKPVAILAWSLFSPMPTVQSSCVAALTLAWMSPGESVRIGGLHRQERLVPAHHLDHRVKLAQRRHHDGGDLLVRGPVHRQEDGLRAAPGRGAQRQPRVHAVGPRLVRGGADDAALGRVAVAADHHGQAAQLRGRAAPRPPRGTGRGRRATPSSATPQCRSRVAVRAGVRASQACARLAVGDALVAGCRVPARMTGSWVSAENPGGILLRSGVSFRTGQSQVPRSIRVSAISRSQPSERSASRRRDRARGRRRYPDEVGYPQGAASGVRADNAWPLPGRRRRASARAADRRRRSQTPSGSPPTPGSRRPTRSSWCRTTWAAPGTRSGSCSRRSARSAAPCW